MEAFQTASDVFFVLMGAIMVLAMHAGFAFLEVGTVRKKNQVNALVKIIVDFAVSTIAYFFVGYSIAYGVDFLTSAAVLSGHAGSDGVPVFASSGYDLVKFFFLLTFAAAIPAIISGGIAERARFYPQLLATAILVGVCYPLFEGMVWNNNRSNINIKSSDKISPGTHMHARVRAHASTHAGTHAHSPPQANACI